MVFEMWGATIAELWDWHLWSDFAGLELLAWSPADLAEPLRGSLSAGNFSILVILISLLFLCFLVGACFGFAAVVMEATYFFCGKKPWLSTPEDRSLQEGFGALWAVINARWFLNLITVVGFYAIRDSRFAADEQKLIFGFLCIFVGMTSAFTRSSLDGVSSLNGLEVGAKVFWHLFLFWDFLLFLMPFFENSGLSLRPRYDAIIGLFFPVLFGHTVRQLMLRKSAS